MKPGGAGGGCSGGEPKGGNLGGIGLVLKPGGGSLGDELLCEDIR